MVFLLHMICIMVVTLMDGLKLQIVSRKEHTALGDYASYSAITNYITDSADDFEFKWGSNDINPDTRHQFTDILQYRSW